jgi:hypothetical protein
LQQITFAMVNQSFLKTWLQNPNYQSGVEFYLLHGSNKTLKNLFQKGPTAFTKKKLQEEIAKLAEVPAQKEKKMKEQVFVPVPDWLTKTAQERIGWIKEQQWLRSQLLHFKTDDERKVAAFKILDLGDLIQIAQMEMDDFKKTGKVPLKEIPKKEGFDYSNLCDISLMEYFYNSFKPMKSRHKNNPERMAELLKEEPVLIAEIEKRRKR